MERSTASSPADRNWQRLSLVLGGILVLIGFYYVRFGELNADEGFYLLSARFVADGLAPYRDFGLTQPPGLPWVYAILLRIFGWSLFGIRIAGLVLMLSSVFLAAWSLLRQNGWREVALLFALLLVSPGWISFSTIGKTYALAGLAVTTGLVVLSSRAPILVRWWIFVFAAALGTVTRLPTVAFFLPASLYLLHAMYWRQRAIALGGAGFAAMAVLFLASAGDWDSMLFWTTELHASVDIARPISTRLGELLAIGPVVFCLLPLCWFARRACGFVPIAGISLVAAIAANVATRTTYGEYATPFVVPAAYLLAICAPQLLGQRQKIPGWCYPAIGLPAALVWLAAPPTSPHILDDAAEAAAYLRRTVPANKFIVASMPEIPVAAGRRVPQTMAMGKFALTESLSRQEAAKVGMATPDRLVELLASEETAALVLSSHPQWNFFWSLPELRFTSQETSSRIVAAINSGYRLGLTNRTYVVFVRDSSSAED